MRASTRSCCWSLRTLPSITHWQTATPAGAREHRSGFRTASTKAFGRDGDGVRLFIMFGPRAGHRGRERPTRRVAERQAEQEPGSWSWASAARGRIWATWCVLFRLACWYPWPEGGRSEKSRLRDTSKLSGCWSPCGEVHRDGRRRADLVGLGERVRQRGADYQG